MSTSHQDNTNSKKANASPTAAAPHDPASSAGSASHSAPSADNTPSAPQVVFTPPKSERKSDFGFKILVITLLVLTFVTAGGALGLSLYNFLRDDAPITFSYGSDGNSANFTEGSIAEVASRVAPGVVSILTETRTSNWFGQSSTQTSAGTGMIVTSDGYVLTNKHVTEGARSISIILDDGTTYEDVELVGSDPLNDVAFLKIKDVSDLPAVTLGNSKTITAGQQVIAIGNALGQYQNTITSGIISGTGRSLTAYNSDMSSSENLTDMIQTDAAINAGNSGGPLVNAAGEVIGINTATSSDADGIGFAIPISSVKGMLKSLIATGKAARAYAGAYYINLTPDIAETYKLPVSSGAYLYTTNINGSNSNSSNIANPIVSGSAADKAGLKAGDIITKVNGVEIGRAGSLSTLIGEYAPGDTIQLTIIRDGQEHTINLTLDAYKG